MLRVVNFISGGGATNLAILEAEKPGGRLRGLVETVAVVSSSIRTAGIQAAIEKGFPPGHSWTISPRADNLAEQLLNILDNKKHQPVDYFHQLGWMPLTPPEVLKRYDGLNQHLGPGGKYMFGVRRIYVHTRFYQEVGRQQPIPIFCQRVAPEYDKGKVIYLRYEDISPNERAEEAAERLLLIEHQVQIEALHGLATGSFTEQPVPQYALNLEEEKLLLRIKREARGKYPRRG